MHNHGFGASSNLEENSNSSDSTMLMEAVASSVNVELQKAGFL